MHKFASFDYQIKLATEIYLPGVSSSAFYGRNIFTTIAAYNTKIFQWEKHWTRLYENARKLNIDLSEFSEELVKESINKLILKNNFQNGRIRVTFFDGNSTGIWAIDTKKKAILLITTADFREFSDETRLTISPFLINSRSPLINIKSGNYLENILALEEIRNRGFDEAVRLNERGEIVSAIMANLFWVKDEKIYTTPLETGALQGTTREFVKEYFQVTEKTIIADELKAADEIFITSAGVGIAKVKSFENKNFKFNKTNSIQEKFHRITQNI